MKMSPEINEIANALSLAQQELKNAVCDTKGHGYEYAQLGQYIDIAKPVLPKYGLSVSQLLGTSKDGKTTLTTILMHKSGQWIRSMMIAPDAVLQGGAGKNPVQVEGAKITYVRRYAYAAILGMSDGGDDDAADLVEPAKYEKPQAFHVKPNQPKIQPKSQPKVESAEQKTAVAKTNVRPLPDSVFDSVVKKFEQEISSGEKDIFWFMSEAKKNNFSVSDAQQEKFNSLCKSK